MRQENNYWIRRLNSSRISRRGFVGGAVAAGTGALGLGLVGCGDDDDNGGGGLSAAATSTPSTKPTLTPKKGGAYNVGFTGPFNGVSPFNSVYGGSGIIPVVYSYLFRNSLLAPEKGNVMDLATSHKVQDDKVTWVFQLRNDAKIAPNKYGVAERAMDADDIVETFKIIADPKSASNALNFFGPWVDKMDAPDKQTFRLITKRPYAFTEASMGNPLWCPIVPKEWLAKGTDQTKADSVGAGPFILKELTEGSIAKMVPNPNYWDKGKPYLDEYNIKAFADQATYRTAFKSGQVDAYGPPDKDEAEQLKNEEKGVSRYSDPGLGYLSFWMNTKQKPWDDPRVRRAFNMAINREEFIQIIGHGVGEPIGPITYAFAAEALPKAELAKLQPFDTAGAKALFQEAGIKEISFTHPTSSNVNDYVKILVPQLEKAGISLKPQPLDAGTWVAQYFNSTLAASLSLNQTYNTPDVALQWYKTGGITGNNKYDTGFSDPEVDKAIDNAAQQLDPKARAAAYQEAQRVIFKKDPSFINFFGLRTEVVARDFVQNLPVGISNLNTAFVKDIWINKA